MSNEISNAESFISWLKTKTELNSVAPRAGKRFVKRGQVYWCHFGLNIGSEISKSTPRPAIVVSNYGINKNSPNILVVPITHNEKSRNYLVPLSPVQDQNGEIILDGQANTANLICVSKARLGDLITSLSVSQMKAIDKSLSLSLDLFSYYDTEKDKYSKLSIFVEEVKRARNDAQDTLDELRGIISSSGFDEESQKNIKKLLDIE